MDFDAKGICPDGNVTNTNNELACDCGEKFSLNTTTNTCDLIPICGVGGKARAECDSKNALCITQENTVGNHTCECPVGKMKNDTDSTNWKCIDVCDFEGPKGSRKSLCSKIHATCDPTKLLDGIDKTLNESEFCNCNPGYVWKDDAKNQCVIGVFTAQFSLRIKNIFRDNFDVNLENSTDHVDVDHNFFIDSNGYANELVTKYKKNSELRYESYQQMRNNSLNNFLIKELTPVLRYHYYVENEEQVAIKECELNDDYYDCTVAVYLTKYFGEFDENANLSENLGEICINTSASSDDCFFFKYPSQKIIKDFESSDSDLFSIVVNEKALAESSFEKYKV